MTLLAEIDTVNDSKVAITGFEWRHTEMLKALPSSWWDRKRTIWTIAKTWPTCLALANDFAGQLEVGPNLKAWMDHEYSTRIGPAYQMREVTALDESHGYARLFPHQRADVLFLSTAERAILANGLGSGKALPVSEPVLTPSGWTTMGELRVGDYVVGKDGKATQVIGTYEQGVRDIYKMSFKDGSFVYCDRNHLWRVTPVKKGHSRILTTGDLMEVGVTQNNGINCKWKIPMVDPVEFTQRSLRLSPYIMGALIGDGSLGGSSIEFTSADPEIVERISRELVDGVSIEKYDCREYGYRFVDSTEGTSNAIMQVVKHYGLYGHRSATKFVPDDYKYSSVEDRVALLQGLMDTDGTVGKEGIISFCTVSLQLAYDVREIVQSLGGTAVWNYHKRPMLGNYDPVVLTIRLPEKVNPFHLQRKAALVPVSEKYHLSRFISNIEFSHREEAKCIVVDAEDHLFVTRDYVVTHNSQSAMSTIRHMSEVQGKDVFPLLVVCPNSTKFSWGREIEQVWPGLRVSVIDGPATQRAKQLTVAKGDPTIPCPVHAPVDVVEDAPKPKSKSKKKPAEPVCMCGSHVIVVNWESVRNHSRLKPYGSIALKKCTEHGGTSPDVKATQCEVHPKDLNMIDFKSVIADEAHRMMDPSSKVSRATKAAAGDARIRLALTGTPIADTPDDLFSILNFLDPEAYPSKLKFLDRYCETHFDAWGNTVVSGIKKERYSEFFQGLDPILRRMPKEVILPFLPPVLRTRRDVEMSAKQQKAYTQMQKQMIAELNGEVISTTSPLTKTTRMLQLASAYGEVDYRMVPDPKTMKMVEKAFVKLADPSCKLDAFMEDLPEYGEDSIVIFTVSSQLANMLSARLTKAGHAHGLITGDQDAMERQKYMDSFQAGRIKYIIVTIAAGGTGITLTKARVAVFLQRSWSMIENTQAEGRIHRIGSEQHESVQIVDYVSTGTCEETVFEAVAEKGRQLQTILRDDALIQKFILGQHIEVKEFPIEEEEAA